MQDINEKINLVLCKWNPIGVSEEIAQNEYRGYVPIILKSILNKNELIKCLEDMLTNKMGLNYDHLYKKDVDDLQQICDDLLSIYRHSQV